MVREEKGWPEVGELRVRQIMHSLSVYSRVCQPKAEREYPFFPQLFSRFAIENLLMVRVQKTGW